MGCGLFCTKQEQKYVLDKPQTLEVASLPHRAGLRAMARWMVARTMPQADHKVQASLALRGLGSYVPRYVVPLQERLRRSQLGRWRCRDTIEVKPLFPTYMFVDTNQFYQLYDIDGLTGVVLRVDGTLATSDRLDEQVAELRDSENEAGFVPAPSDLAREKFKRGQRVKILSGLYRDFSEGEYVGWAGDGLRVRVMLALLGKGVSVVMGEDDLAAA